jgi:hypothetical protein
MIPEQGKKRLITWHQFCCSHYPWPGKIEPNPIQIKIKKRRDRA